MSSFISSGNSDSLSKPSHYVISHQQQLSLSIPPSLGYGRLVGVLPHFQHSLHRAIDALNVLYRALDKHIDNKLKKKNLFFAQKPNIKMNKHVNKVQKATGRAEAITSGRQQNKQYLIIQLMKKKA